MIFFKSRLKLCALVKELETKVSQLEDELNCTKNSNLRLSRVYSKHQFWMKSFEAALKTPNPDPGRAAVQAGNALKFYEATILEIHHEQPTT